LTNKIYRKHGIVSKLLFIKSAISSFTKEFSIHKLYNTLKSQGIKVSKKTLYNFQKILEDIQVFFFLRKYSKSLRKLEMSIPKVHLVDPGLYNYTVEEDISRTMENLVFLELLKNGLAPNTNIFYFNTKEKYEVDFLIKEGLRVKQLIQVTYANNFDEIEPREYRALLHAKELFKAHKPELIVITWDYEDEKELTWFGKKGVIKFVPLWKWLLNI
jgi:predicted AAA+ superfamily ATPase